MVEFLLAEIWKCENFPLNCHTIRRLQKSVRGCTERLQTSAYANVLTWVLEKLHIRLIEGAGSRFNSTEHAETAKSKFLEWKFFHNFHTYHLNFARRAEAPANIRSGKYSNVDAQQVAYSHYRGSTEVIHRRQHLLLRISCLLRTLQELPDRRGGSRFGKNQKPIHYRFTFGFVIFRFVPVSNDKIARKINAELLRSELLYRAFDKVWHIWKGLRQVSPPPPLSPKQKNLVKSFLKIVSKFSQPPLFGFTASL